ncbi:MAG TPA: hypothetical protein VHZ96_26360 [Frankiaceae bacterium]|nr:hypothetical protein [Frankiaceae bacterium]
MTLHVSEELDLPLEFATEAWAVLARRGAGKSNALIVIAEELHANGLPFVHIDPKGDSWGIRSNGDGTGPGLAVPVFGGRHGDVPLESTAGALIADLVLGDQASYLSCVLDVSSFSKGEAKRFLHDFGDRLFRQKDESGVLTLLFEEAHEYLPQRVGRDEAQLVNVYQRIVKQGRQRGLGCGMATQRSAALNKDVLTQVGALIPMWIMSPQDRSAIKDWVEVGGEAPELIGSLHSLKPGEAWIWWPERYDRQQRITFRRRWTFDSGATPKPGQRRAEPRILADVDLAAVKEAMADTIEKVKADDPRELRKRIRELERQVAERPEPTVEYVEVASLTPEIVAGLRDGLIGAVSDATLQLMKHTREHQTPIGQAASTRVEAVQRGSSAPRRPRSSPGDSTTPGAADAGKTRQGRPEMRPDVPVGDLTNSSQRVLDAIAWLHEVGFAQPTKIQAGFIAGYRVGKQIGGRFGNVLGQLRSAGLIDYPSAGAVALTDAGRAVATSPDIEQTTAGLQTAIYARLTESERRVLEGIVADHPNALSKQEAGERGGYTVGPAIGGRFGNILGRLRTLGLIDYPSPGFVAATDLLFLD